MANLTVEVKDHIAVMSLHHGKNNLCSWEFMREVADTLKELEAMEDVRVLVIRSALQHFSMGAPLQGIQEYVNMPDDATRAARIQHTVDAIVGVYNFRCPVVCAANGMVVGAAAALAAVCDVCVASDDARFSVPEINAGWIGASEFFQLSVPRRLARYYVYTGKFITAQELRSYGGLMDVVPRERLDARAMELADDFAQQPPLAVEYFKKAMNHNDNDRLVEKYMHEFEFALKYFHTRDFQESMDAFFAKPRRKPKYIRS